MIGFIQPLEFLENAILLLRRNARAGIAYFNPDMMTTPATADQHPAFARIAHGVADQIEQHPLHQLHIAVHRQA